MTTQRIVPFAFLCLLPAADAALLAYDGFDSTVYNAVPLSSGGGYKDPTAGFSDALFYDSNTVRNDGTTEVGQNPSVFGFTGAWRYNNNISSSVYPRLEASQLSYAGLTSTTVGQLNLFRSASSGSSKSFSRSLNAGPSTNFGQVLYIGGMIQRTADTSFSLSMTMTNGTDTRNFSMTIATDGNGSLTGTDATTVSSGSPLWAVSTPQFFVLKLENSVLDGVAGGTNGDQMSLYLNPDLSNEGANVASLVLGDEDASFFVSGNSGWSFGSLTVGSSMAAPGQSLIFDEFKIGTEWADMLAAIPEPGTAALAMMSLMVLARRRR